MVKLDQDLLSSVFVNTDLRGLSWPFFFEGILTQLISFSSSLNNTGEGQIFELGDELVVKWGTYFSRFDLAVTPPVVNNTVNLYLERTAYLPEGSGETAITYVNSSLSRISTRNGQTASAVMTEVNWSNYIPSGFGSNNAKYIGNLFEYKGNYSIIVWARNGTDFWLLHEQYDKETLTPIVENRIIYDVLSTATSTSVSVVDGTDLYSFPSALQYSHAEGSQFFKVHVLDLDSNAIKREFFLPYGIKPSWSLSKISMTFFKGKLVVMSHRLGEYHIYASDDKGETWYELYSGSELIADYQPNVAHLKVFDDRLLIVCGLNGVDSRIIELM